MDSILPLRFILNPTSLLALVLVPVPILALLVVVPSQLLKLKLLLLADRPQLSFVLLPMRVMKATIVTVSTLAFYSTTTDLIVEKSVRHLTCFYFLNGGCKKSDEDCLYAHYLTGKLAERPAPVVPGGE